MTCKRDEEQPKDTEIDWGCILDCLIMAAMVVAFMLLG